MHAEVTQINFITIKVSHLIMILIIISQLISKQHV